MNTQSICEEITTKEMASVGIVLIYTCGLHVYLLLFLLKSYDVFFYISYIKRSHTNITITFKIITLQTHKNYVHSV